ncbi:MAG: SOS-response transcriptional regulator UmuD-like protein [Bacteroidia bacterium]|nr:MAG: SOS-response transcriptional regulator UmuD-like protein [Bacteroidia bacterium]
MIKKLKIKKGFPRIEIFRNAPDHSISLPFIETPISAGFPSPALDYIDKSIDLNTLLIKHPSATFFGRVSGFSMKDAGIDDGDILIIDRSIEPSDNKIAVCFIDGEFTAKRIRLIKNELWLYPENSNFEPIRITEENNFIIWGIVTYVIKKL